MQNVSSTTAARVNNLQAVTLQLALYGEAPFTVDVVSCRYSARANGSNEFSIGNACSSGVTLTLEATARLGVQGRLVQVLWSVDSTQHPLFTGYVTRERMEGGKLVIEASDAIYALGGTKAIPTGEEATAGDCLATIAGQMSLVVESSTAQLAENLPLTLDSLPENATCAKALALISGCLGGNAVITRDGLLAVRYFSTVDFSAETYDGGDTTEADSFAPTGVTFFHKTNEEDGTTTELRFEAGDGALELENELADQTCANCAWAALDGLSFVPGSFSIPGGLLLECGDVFRVNGYAVACMDLSMDIDGGVKTTVTAYGSETKGGATGSLNQRVNSALERVNKVQQQVAQEKKERKQSVEELNAALAGASGLFETVVEQADGTTIQYLHDKATLEASTLVIVVNSGGMGISNDGGETYQYGFTFDGDAILNELHAEGIYGVNLTLGGTDNVKGTLKILDSDGDELGCWDNSGIQISGAESDHQSKLSRSGFYFNYTHPSTGDVFKSSLGSTGFRVQQNDYLVSWLGNGVLQLGYDGMTDVPIYLDGTTGVIKALGFACGGVTGYTGDVVIGDVTLTITGGIITAVS